MASASSEDINVAFREAMAREDFAAVKALVAGKNSQHLSAAIQQEIDLENARIDIAITGLSGAGKSSLVNALRGMKDDDEHAAEAGIIETTMVPTPYIYPPFPNFTIWDLPGIGRPNFKADEYLKQVRFDRYDFFIIVASDRFTENDIEVAREIKKRKKKFYFVRSKMDISIKSEQQKKKNSKEEETLKEIRKYCEESLKMAGLPPVIYLISSWETDKYDFSRMKRQMQNDLDIIRKNALAMFMPVLTKEDLNQKKEAMGKYIWKQSLLSCETGITFVPGISPICDIGILKKTMEHIIKVFGLDDDFLYRLAKNVSKSVHELKSAIRHCPTDGEISTEMVTHLLNSSVDWESVETGIRFLHYIPLVGYMFAKKTSSNFAYSMLMNFMNNIVKDIEKVLEKARE